MKRHQGQLSLNYFDVIPPKHNNSHLFHNDNAKTGETRIKVKIARKKTNQKQNAGKTENDKLSPKHARLMFYSTLAAQSNPSTRVTRKLRYPDDNSSGLDTNNIPAQIVDDIPRGLEDAAEESSRRRSQLLSETRGMAFSALRQTKNIKRRSKMDADQVQRATLPRTAAWHRSKLDLNKKVVITLVIALVFVASLTFSINQSINRTRQIGQNQAQTQAEWEHAKLQWECTLARHQAQQQNAVLDNEKEKICANIDTP